MLSKYYFSAQPYVSIDAWAKSSVILMLINLSFQEAKDSASSSDNSVISLPRKGKGGPANQRPSELLQDPGAQGLGPGEQGWAVLSSSPSF